MHNIYPLKINREAEIVLKNIVRFDIPIRNQQLNSIQRVLNIFFIYFAYYNIFKFKVEPSPFYLRKFFFYRRHY